MDEKYIIHRVFYARACGGAESNPRLWKWGVMACDVIVEKVEGGENRALHETDINWVLPTSECEEAKCVRRWIDYVKPDFGLCVCVRTRRRFNKVEFARGVGRGNENESIGM